MKKLMVLGALSAIAGGVLAASSGIVGYNTFDLKQSQKTLKANNFVTTSGAGIDLATIVPKDGGEVAESDGVRIWWWDTTKGNQYAVWSEYCYNPEDPNADGDGYVVFEEPEDFVWTDTDEDYPRTITKPFSAGEGFFVQPTAARPSLTFSGAVLGSDNTEDPYRTVALTQSQKKLIASPFPQAFDLSSLVPFDGTQVAESDGVKIWWWDTAKGNQYAVWSEYYYDPEDPNADDDGYVVFENPEDFVWTDTDEYYPKPVIKTFAAGEGFFVQPTAANPVLAFPNPFYKGE